MLDEYDEPVSEPLDDPLELSRFLRCETALVISRCCVGEPNFFRFGGGMGEGAFFVGILEREIGEWRRLSDELRALSTLRWTGTEIFSFDRFFASKRAPPTALRRRLSFVAEPDESDEDRDLLELLDEL